METTNRHLGKTAEELNGIKKIHKFCQDKFDENKDN